MVKSKTLIIGRIPAIRKRKSKIKKGLAFTKFGKNFKVGK